MCIFNIDFIFSLTNPLLYNLVRNSVPTPDRWCEKLSADENVTLKAKIDNAKERWDAAYKNITNHHPERLGRNFGPWAAMNRASTTETKTWDTGFNRESLRWILAKSVQVPEDFALHQQLERHTKQRLEAAETGKKIDWGAAEAMAFGSILQVNKSSVIQATLLIYLYLARVWNSNCWPRGWASDVCPSPRCIN